MPRAVLSLKECARSSSPIGVTVERIQASSVDLRHVGLKEERAALRIETAGQKIERHPTAVFPQCLRILQTR